jgi:single-strand DNA-binding protein
MNKVILIGRLGADPEMRTFDNGNKCANFSFATSEKFTNKDGEKVEQTEWHKVAVFGKVADIIEKYCHKGDQLAIEGKIKTRKYEQNGETKYMTEVVVDLSGKIEMLGKSNAATMTAADTSNESSSPANTQFNDLPY